MKKIIYLVLMLVSISCTSVKEIIKNENFKFMNVTKVEKNKIENLEIKNNLDLRNDEVNVYLVRNLKINPLSKIKLDIDYSRGIADGLYIENSNKGILNIELSNLGEEKTINKKIPIITTKKENDLVVNVKTEILDNTLFEVLKEEKNGYYMYSLNPIFIDEDTYEEKVTEDINISSSNVAFYEENLIENYHEINIINGLEYNDYYSKIAKGYILEGEGIKGSNIVFEYNDGSKVMTIVDDKGYWSIAVNKEKGNMKVYQIVDGAKSQEILYDWGE